MAEKMTVEVAYALPCQQWVLSVTLDIGATVGDCIEQSGIGARVPDLEVRDGQVGIYGRVCDLDSPVSHGDRIEIYRPLKQDPKQLRRERARQQAGRQHDRKKD